MRWLDDNGEIVKEVGSWTDASEGWGDKEYFVGEQEDTGNCGEIL